MLTKDQHEELNKWAAQVKDRATLEDFWGWLNAKGFNLRTEKEPWASEPLSFLLDRYFEVDRQLLEAARRALLTEAASQP